MNETPGSKPESIKEGLSRKSRTAVVAVMMAPLALGACSSEAPAERREPTVVGEESGPLSRVAEESPDNPFSTATEVLLSDKTPELLSNRYGELLDIIRGQDAHLWVSTLEEPGKKGLGVSVNVNDDGSIKAIEYFPTDQHGVVEPASELYVDQATTLTGEEARGTIDATYELVGLLESGKKLDVSIVPNLIDTRADGLLRIDVGTEESGDNTYTAVFAGAGSATHKLPLTLQAAEYILDR